jgi:hypothetical protein
MIKQQCVLIILITLSLFLPFEGLTQEKTFEKGEKVYLESTDVYLVNLQIDTIFLNKTFNIRSTFGNQLYRICQIRINDVIYMGDTIYVKSKDLRSAQFMLFKDKTILTQDTSFNASLFASSIHGVHFLSRFLSDEELKAEKYSYHAIITHLDINNKKLYKFLSKQGLFWH